MSQATATVPPTPPETPGSGIWSGLGSKLDPMARSPHPIPDAIAVRQVDSAGRERWILKNPREGTYVSLSPQEFELFRTFAPGLTLSEVCRKMIEEKSIFPFFILGPCLGKLYSAKFLQDAPAPVLATIAERLRARSWRARLGRIFHRTVRLSGLDPLFTRLYEGAFRTVYRPVVLLVLHAIAAIGVADFLVLFLEGRHGFLDFRGGFAVEFPIVLGLLAVVIFLHELGHAFAVKASGRDVDRAGMALALFLPVAFFVETGDMWMEDRKSRRMGVSWAGPFVNLLAVALAAGALRILGDDSPVATSVVYKTALLSLVLFFMNMNPVLPTDGYFLLMDWLEIPSLARRGGRFVRDGLWRKLRSRTPLSREERIFAAYGALAAAWSVLATAISFSLFVAFVRFLMRQWDEGGVVLRALLVVLGTSVTLPFCYFLFGLLDRVVTRLFFYFFARGYFHDPAKLVALATGVVGAILVPPSIAYALSWGPFASEAFTHAAVGLAGIGSAMVAIWTIQRSLAYRFHRGVLLGLVGFLALSSVHRLLVVFLRIAGAEGAAVWASAVLLTAMGASLAVVAHWFLTFHLDRPATVWERLLLALAPVASLLVAAPLVPWTTWAPPGARVLFVLGGLFWSTALSAWSVVWITSLWQSRFRLPFGAMGLSFALGLGAHLGAAAGSALLETFVGVLSTATLFVGLGALHLGLSRLRFERKGGKEDLLLPEVEKLRRAFAGFIEDVMRGVRESFGPRKAGAITRRFNDYLIRRAYGLAVLDGEVLDQVPASSTIAERGLVYGDAFSALLDLVGAEFGWGFTDRLVENLYDSLYWAEREVVTAYLFRGRRWDEAKLVVGREPAPLEFLRRIPLFYEFDEAQLRVALDACQIRRYRPGDTILSEGDTDRDLYMIRRGIVDVYGGGRHINSLSDHDCFGEVALVEDRPRTATVVARVATECYVLGRDEFESIVRPALGPDFELMRVINRIGTLRQFDLLERTSPMTLARLLQQSVERSYRAGERIVRQGELGEHFYIILEGVVRVVREAPDGTETPVAERRRGEYFGEIALVRHIPRTASVYAATDCDLLVITKDDFDAFFKETQQIAQFSSRRLAVIEEMERAGAGPA